MSEKVRWGIIGTGAIARCFAENIQKSRTGVLAAVGSRSSESASKFAGQFGAERAHGSYENLLADAKIDAVYISTPHPMHAEWAIKAARAGKHVLCEKPFTLNWPQAMAVFEAAELAGVTVMEAFMWRCHPQTAKLVELLKQKVIGDVGVVQASYGFRSGFNAASRLWANELAGGGIMDVGCYPVSAARLIAGAATGEGFADPTHVTGAAKLAETGVDVYAVGTLKFASGIVAEIATGVGQSLENVVRIFGTEGSIYVPDPWLADRKNPPQGRIIINKSGKADEIIVASEQTSFTLLYDAIGEAIQAKQPQGRSPGMTWNDTLGQIKTLDQWREACGVKYDIETSKAYPSVTLSGEALAPNPNAMKYLQIAGLDKKISRLILGHDNQRTLSQVAVMNDDFFEKGGNAFDTAYIYGGGVMERMLGQWLKLRGVRDACTVIVKGCHTPMNDPVALVWQLNESLDRLQINSADIYMMHRDNPHIPVAEFVDVLNEQVRAGRIKLFGGSNWALDRVQQANEYAASKGLQGFSVVSNNFSLARMIKPIWGGCVAASDPDSREWFKQTQTTLLSWSSQARGFFLPGRAAPDKLDDRELVDTWYSEGNFERLKRAQQLAEKYGVSPINIALAYVLRQPFPTIALIGPRQLSETRTSLPGLDIQLTAEEVEWLNLDE